MLPNTASRKYSGIMHPIPGNPGTEQPGQAYAGAGVVGRFAGVFSSVPPEEHRDCAARPFRPVGLTAQTGCRQALCVAWSWFRQSGVISSRPPAGTPQEHAGQAASRLARGESEYRVKIYETKDFKWARRLSKNDIYRLYKSEASGLLTKNY